MHSLSCICTPKTISCSNFSCVGSLSYSKSMTSLSVSKRDQYDNQSMCVISIRAMSGSAGGEPPPVVPPMFRMSGMPAIMGWAAADPMEALRGMPPSLVKMSFDQSTENQMQGKTQLCDCQLVTRRYAVVRSINGKPNARHNTAIYAINADRNC